MAALIRLTDLMDEADKLFSKWIRNRDTVDGLYIQNEEGLSIPCGYCFTCGRVTPTEGIMTGDAGHFIDRAVMFLRYDPRNAHLQCHSCNHFLGGNKRKYTAKLIESYGYEVLEELFDIEAEYKRNKEKLKRKQLEEIIERYK